MMKISWHSPKRLESRKFKHDGASLYFVTEKACIQNKSRVEARYPLYLTALSIFSSGIVIKFNPNSLPFHLQQFNIPNINSNKCSTFQGGMSQASTKTTPRPLRSIVASFRQKWCYSRQKPCPSIALYLFPPLTLFATQRLCMSFFILFVIVKMC